MNILVIACSSGILSLFWRHTEMAPSPLLCFCTYPPPHAQEQTQTPLFLYSHPLTVRTEERKQDQTSLRTDIMWMFCVMLHGDVTAEEATPLLLQLVSSSPASWGSAAKPSGFSEIFLQIFRADTWMQVWLILHQLTSDYSTGLLRNSNWIT